LSKLGYIRKFRPKRFHKIDSSSAGGDGEGGGGSDDFLQLTSKILFDSAANLKTIDLGLVLKETSLCWALSPEPPKWINWLVDFFTVVVSCPFFAIPFCSVLFYSTLFYFIIYSVLYFL
jgi:hypothetical protein